jgi:hypothetical protein
MRSSILASWPWNINSARDLSEMEIYTRRFSVGEHVRFVVPHPMDGFCWTGAKVLYHHTNQNVANPNAVLATPSMIQISSNNFSIGVIITQPWTMLPMVMNEVRDGTELSLEVLASYGIDPSYVQVELLAQRV